MAPSTSSLSAKKYRAVFFDFGGVVLSSPFEAFENYERNNDLPAGLIRTVNSTNPDANAWAQLERGEVGVDQFASMFESEASALGHAVDGHAVIAMLAGTVRPTMVTAIERIKQAGLVTACLTNNFNDRNRGNEAHDSELAGSTIDGHDSRSEDEKRAAKDALALFDVLVESSVVGVRKPEPTFYRRALKLANVHPEHTIFLDDLGINLKPARAMGMTTIKVVDPMVALAELHDHLGIDLG